jgi:hypothetical protein
MNSFIQIIIFIYALIVTEATQVSISGASYNCSGQLNSEVACSNAFDNNVNSFWMNDIDITSTQQQYVDITLSSPMIVASYEVYMLSSSAMIGLYDYSFQVTSWAFLGSNNESSYTTLSTVTNYNILSLANSGYIVFNCTSPASYNYRFHVIANWFISNGYSTSDQFMLVELVLNGTSSPSSQPTSSPSQPSSSPTPGPSPSPTIPIQTTPSVPSGKSNTAVIIAVISSLVVVAIVVAVLFRAYTTKQQQGQQGTGTTEREAAISPISHRISVSHTTTEQQNPMQSTTQRGI